MVDLLAKRKPVGFRVDIFPDFERQKAEHAAEKGIEPTTAGVALWEPDDERWRQKPPYGFRPYTLKWGGPCVYCAEKIPAGERALYSRALNSVAHVDCHAGYDREVPPGGVKPSVSDRLHDR